MWARYAVAVAVAVSCVCCCATAVAASVASRAGSATGGRVTLTLGVDATPGQIDDVQPNEEFEEGLVGEPRPPQDTPYKPTESQTTSGAPSPAQRTASDHFTLLRSTPTNPLGGSVVQEPTAVNDGNVILATGNTWARLSTDDGLTWPSSLVPNPASNPPPGDKVCCDQVADAVDRGDHTLAFWLLLSPSMFGIKNSFFDFNKMSSTGKFLYVVTDVRTLTHTSGGAEIIRLSLNHLDDGDCRFSWRAWNVKKEPSLAPVEHAGSTMFFAAHTSDTTTATQDKRFPFPQVRVAVFRTSSLKLVQEHTSWNKKFAWTYPAVGVNERHQLGIVLYEMGGGRFPSADAFLRPDPRDWSGITMHRIATGSASFSKNVWGDYASVHGYAGCPNSFLGTAFTVQSNAGTTASENRSVWFGKSGDGCADLAVTAVLALPTQVLVGGTLSIVHTTKNLGSASAGPTTTRYYLSRDAARGEGDVALGATSAEPTLVAGGASNPAATLSAVIPAVAPGTYHLIACANDSHPVSETSATNNCFSPPETFTIGVTAG